MIAPYEMKENFFEVANAYFDKDKEGSLNEAEMQEMLQVYALHKLSLEEHYKLPKKTREIVEELRAAHILDVNAKLHRERHARVKAEVLAL